LIIKQKTIDTTTVFVELFGLLENGVIDKTILGFVCHVGFENDRELCACLMSELVSQNRRLTDKVL
jgi:hypothetical protein